MIEIPEPGMWADHKSGTLDPREVKQVHVLGRLFTLQIGSVETDWLYVDDYYFYEKETTNG